jgi:hypothetical protein
MVKTNEYVHSSIIFRNFTELSVSAVIYCGIHPVANPDRGNGFTILTSRVKLKLKTAKFGYNNQPSKFTLLKIQKTSKSGKMILYFLAFWVIDNTTMRL